MKSEAKLINKTSLFVVEMLMCFFNIAVPPLNRKIRITKLIFFNSNE